MSKKIYFLLIVLVTCTAINSFAQLSLANKYYYMFAYSKAIDKYESVLKQDTANLEAQTRLADCYRLTGNNVKAEKWYAKAVKQLDSPSSNYYYYAQALMTNGKYDQARIWNGIYRQKESGDIRAKNLASALEKMPSFYTDSVGWNVKKLNVNSAAADFSPVFYDNGIVFASARDEAEWISNEDMWTGENFLTLYYAENKAGEFKKPVRFERKLQTKYNNGPISFTKAWDELMLTSNNISEGRMVESRDGTIKLKLYYAKRVKGEWTDLTSFKYNSDDYNCMHAAFSPDGRVLYFASDMQGGMGGIDIWACRRQGDTWGAPVNLGGKVNSKGNEVFPFVTDDYVLYFSSDGLEGMGGLDVFYTQENGGKYAKPENILAPVNSSADDFAVAIDKEKRIGYLSSNRDKATADDIYSFTFKDMRFYIDGIVTDEITKSPVAKINVQLLNKSTKERTSFTTTADGKFGFLLSKNCEYEIVAATSNSKFKSKIEKVSTQNKKQGEKFFVPLSIANQSAIVGIGTVRDGATNLPLKGLKVEVTNNRKSATDILTTDDNGKFMLSLDSYCEYTFVVKQEGYVTSSLKKSTLGLKAPFELPIEIILDKY